VESLNSILSTLCPSPSQTRSSFDQIHTRPMASNELICAYPRSFVQDDTNNILYWQQLSE